LRSAHPDMAFRILNTPVSPKDSAVRSPKDCGLTEKRAYPHSNLATAASCVSDLCFVISSLFILLFGLNNQSQEKSLYVKRVRALRMTITNFQKANFKKRTILFDPSIHSTTPSTEFTLN